MADSKITLFFSHLSADLQQKSSVATEARTGKFPGSTERILGITRRGFKRKQKTHTHVFQPDITPGPGQVALERVESEANPPIDTKALLFLAL